MKKLILALFIFLPLYAQASETVVLLHGIFRTSSSMEKLEHALEDNGYNVINITYPSTKQPLEDIVDTIHPQITPAYTDNKIHFITHSMGGLVARAYINKHRPPNLGNVVMVSPPSQGSEVADFMVKHVDPLYKWLYGPAGQQLITDQHNISNTLGEVNYPTGIIRATRSIDPFSSWIIPGKDDGKVSLKRMQQPQVTHYVDIPASHTYIMKNKDSIMQSIHFLKNKSFIHTNQPF